MLTLAIWAIRAFYLLSSLAILLVHLTPALANRFLAYGARANLEANSAIVKKPAKQTQKAVGIKFLDDLATLTVPHSWFIHFYILSVSCSIVFLSVFYYHDYHDTAIKHSQNLEIAAFTSHLMLLQGLRRFLECIYVTRISTSRMWIGHYAIGMAFYLVTNLAIWVDHFDFNPATETQKPRLRSSDTEQPGILWTWKTAICTLLFFAASEQQNFYHKYLSSLEKYTLPKKHAFRYIIAPHYTVECAIYLILAVVDAPVSFAEPAQQHTSTPISTLVNWTLLCALVFVTVNLGVTAHGTKQWQREKFRDESYEITKRWKMIPFLY